MKIRKAILICTVAFLIAQVGIGQGFHRLYPIQSEPNVYSVVSDAMQRADGLYATVEFMITQTGPQESYCDTLIYSEFKAKGDNQRSFKIYVDPSKYGFINTVSKAIVTQDAESNMYIAFTTLDTKKERRHYCKVGADDKITIYTISNLQSVVDSIQGGSFIAAHNKNLIHAAVTGDANELSVNLIKRAIPGANASNNFNIMLEAKDENGENHVEAISAMAVDSKRNRIAITGIVDSLNPRPYILLTDTLGRVLMSKTYIDVESFISIAQPNSIVINPDTSVTISGSNIVLVPPFSINVESFVIRTDKRGDIIWSKIINLDPSRGDITKGMTLDANNDLVITNASIDLNTGETTHYAVKLTNTFGEVKQKKKYPRVQGLGDFGGNVIRNYSGGTAWFHTALRDDVEPMMSFIKLDNELSTTCETEITTEIITDRLFQADTLIWTRRNVGLITDSTKVKAESNIYDIPVLSLEVRPFCPNEPINWLFKVPIEGATNYKWSTGDEGAMLDSLRVFKEDKYAVTVTVDKDVCFMLCDTSTLARYDKPTAYAGVELGSFCQTNAIRINSGFNPGHPEITAISWSNGEKDKLSIDVTTAGTYTVAYTDGCGEIATATVTTGQLPVKITKAEITPKVDYDCIVGEFKGSLEANGNSTSSGPFSLGVETFLWSNDNTNRTINIDQDFEGLFTVTVTDGCGTTATATYELKAQGKNELAPSLFVDKNQICETGNARINVFNQKNGRIAYKWATGEVTPFIDTKTPGVYTVTVTDLCKNTATAEGTFSIDDITPSNLSYPRVFFPDGMAQILNTDTTELDLMQIDALKLNRTFGPILKTEVCPNNIQDYEFFVFNRWGQKVFESTNIADEWDGRQDGEDRHLSDTFVWVARYKIFGVEKTVKGDINLLR